MEPDRSVGIATWLRAGRPGYDFRQGQENFLFSIASRPALGRNQPSIQRVPDVIFPGVKRSGREDGQSPPSSAEVDNDGAISPLHGTVLN
jgi:hypothetical protein